MAKKQMGRIGDAEFSRLEAIGRELLEVIGEDASRPGLLETPTRFARYWRDFVNYDPGNTNKTFETTAANQMVVVSGIRVWSLCEHHMLPFWCDISIGYIAEDVVLGLSKFARIAHKYAHRLQTQEHLVEQVADEVERLSGSKNVAVLSRGKHTCMIMRGIKTDGIMTSSVMRGIFMHGASARSEFLALAMQNNHEL